MKENIIKALQESKNTNICNTSVIFENNNTGKVSFFNGLTSSFEFITNACFEELKVSGIITREKCICQGDKRYIINR
jgi:hypothetical protein